MILAVFGFWIHSRHVEPDYQVALRQYTEGGQEFAFYAAASEDGRYRYVARVGHRPFPFPDLQEVGYLSAQDFQELSNYRRLRDLPKAAPRARYLPADYWGSWEYQGQQQPMRYADFAKLDSVQRARGRLARRFW